MNTLKTFVLMLAMSGILLLAGALIGGNAGVIIALILAVAMNGFTYWSSDKLALRAAHAKEVSPSADSALHSIVDDQVRMAGIPKPRVYLIESDSPNAFATGRNPKHASIAVTTGIRTLLTREELGGVIAHELAHVGNRDTLIMSIVATFAIAVGLLATMAQFAMIFGGFSGGGRSRGGGNAMIGIVGLLIVAIVLPIVASIIRLSISRTREFQADATGAKTSHDPGALANALEKLDKGTRAHPMKVAQGAAHLFIVNPLSRTNVGSQALAGNGFSRLFSTHPPVTERVKRLRNMKAGW